MALVVASRLEGDEPLESERFDVLDFVCGGDPFDYWAGLNSVWGTDDLVNVEHDMEYSDDLVDDLLGCEHELCAFPYIVFAKSFRGFTTCAHWRGQWLNGELKDFPWATFSAIGFCKIAKSAQTRPLKRQKWEQVEYAIEVAAVKGANRIWHMHWPLIAHGHDYTVEPYYRAG